MKHKCRYCHAKVESLCYFRNQPLCQDCFYEYAKIFDGYKNKEERSKEKKQETKKPDEENPLFEAFRRGWEHEERENGLNPMRIPDWMKDSYEHFYKVEKKRWDDAMRVNPNDKRYFLKDFKQEGD